MLKSIIFRIVTDSQFFEIFNFIIESELLSIRSYRLKSMNLSNNYRYRVKIMMMFLYFCIFVAVKLLGYSLLLQLLLLLLLLFCFTGILL